VPDDDERSLMLCRKSIAETFYSEKEENDDL
jgi:hypothetical protein